MTISAEITFLRDDGETELELRFWLDHGSPERGRFGPVESYDEGSEPCVDWESDAGDLTEAERARAEHEAIQAGLVMMESRDD